MFRDESSQVIKKANARTRKRAVSSLDKSTPSSTKPASKPVKLTWSPDDSISEPSHRRPSRQSSSSSSPGSATSSPPSTFITTFQLSRERGIENEGGQAAKQELGIPGPLPCQMTPSFEDRGLNLFIARYITVVSSFEVHQPGLHHVLTSACCSPRTPAITNLTCKSHNFFRYGLTYCSTVTN